MNKGTHSESDWYDLWMKQSKEFFETANENLKELFDKNPVLKPEEHLKQIHRWLEALKAQWEFVQLTEEQKVYAKYWNTMSKMCNEATDLMMGQWVERSRGQNPIKNVRELYELWLNCCHEVYTKAMHSKAYQEAYINFMDEAVKFWKSHIPMG